MLRAAPFQARVEGLSRAAHFCRRTWPCAQNPHHIIDVRREGSVNNPRFVASLDRKRLGQGLRVGKMLIRGVFDKETRRKPLAFAADAVRYGI